MKGRRKSEAGSEEGKLWENEGMQGKAKRAGGKKGELSGFRMLKASRSQRFSLNLEQTTNAECPLWKAEWMIIMAACFNLIPSASLRWFLKRAVTGKLTCGQAYNLHLQFRHLAAALIQSDWQRLWCPVIFSILLNDNETMWRTWTGAVANKPEVWVIVEKQQRFP